MIKQVINTSVCEVYVGDGDYKLVLPELHVDSSIFHKWDNVKVTIEKVI